MTASIAYLFGSSNSLIWSWFFWVYVHPLASITWFVFCLFTLVISIEVDQLQKNNKSSSAMNPSYKVIENSPKVIEVIVIPPPQLSYSKVTHTQARKTSLALAQLPNSFE